MHHSRLFALAVSAVALASCNPFRSSQAVEVSNEDKNLNSRWHANLASPADLAGVTQMNGSASMAPASKPGTTMVSLELANATPGGLHPWQLHRGQCGTDEGVIGSAGEYPAAKVGRDGRASVTTNLPLQTPTRGTYFVAVQASAANSAVTVACGNLAAPTL